MKKMKKIVSFLLAAIMVMAMSVTAFAEEKTYIITISGAKDGHTYGAYQIFKGDLHDENGKKILSNITWGDGVNTTTLKEKLGAEFGCTTDKGELDAVKVAEKIALYANNSNDSKSFAKAVGESLTTTENFSTFTAGTEGKKGTYTISGLKAGYYLVKDTAALTGDDAFTDFIITVVGNAEATVKSAWPTFDKQVHDEPADAEEGAADGWGETADHAINESFQFKLTAHIPNDPAIDAYPTYELIFHDDMSNGVTFESIASVKIGETLIKPKKSGNESDEESEDAFDENGYQCSASDDQDGGDWHLRIEDLKLYKENIKGEKVTVIYNAHLNREAVVNNASAETSANNENKNTAYLEYSNDPNDKNKTGKTTEDSVWVFTYEVDNKKVDGTTDDKKELKGAGFRLYDSEGTTEIKLTYDKTKGAYRPVKEKDSEEAVEMLSAESGVFNIIGLDAGKYVLKETTTPSGYSTCPDVTILIEATHKENEEGTNASVVISNDSNMKNVIENKQGSTLPSTGGIGTTIFYVCGTVLVLFAGVLLVTKKRMNANK